MFGKARDVSTGKYYRQGIELYYSGNYLGALEEYEKAIQTNPSYPAKAWSAKGDALYALNRFKEALEAYEKTLSLNSKDAEIWNNKIVTLFRLRRYGEALNTCEEALKHFPQNSCILNNKGDALFKLHAYEAALQAYEGALTLDSKNIDIWNNKIIALYKLKRFDEALKLCDQAFEHFPEKTCFLRNKGDILYELNRFEDALKVYEEALLFNSLICDDSEEEVTRNDKGAALYKLCRYEEALDVCIKTLERFSINGHTWKNKGDILYKLGQYEKALEAYEEAIKLDIEDDDAWNGKGKMLQNLGHFDKALEAYNKAIDLNSTCDSWCINKGFLLLCQREFSQANKIFASEKFKEGKVDAFVGKGLLSILENELINAERCFNIVTEKDPNFSSIIPYNLTLYHLGKNLIDYYKMRAESAEEKISTNKVQQDTIYYFLQGLGFIVLNNLKSAEQSFNEILKVVPNHKPAQEQIAGINQAITQRKKLTVVSRDDTRSTISLMRELNGMNEELEKALNERNRLVEENEQLKEKVANLGNELYKKIERPKKVVSNSSNISSLGSSMTRILRSEKQTGELEKPTNKDFKYS